MVDSSERIGRPFVLFVFFFNDTATTEIYTLSLHDALPISSSGGGWGKPTICADGYHFESEDSSRCVADEVIVENVTEENEGDAFNASAGEVPEEDESNEFFSAITGAVTGAGAARNIGIGLLFLLIILALFSIVRSHKKK